MSDEVVVDGVTYVRLFSPVQIYGNPSGIWDQFSEKEREEIRRRMIAHLVETGYYMRKDDYKKKHSIYKKDELFYGM